tara:strand:+ start:285 stop:860 length:576 start_codon:yes stop_codon:yes gene_type:complete
MAEVTFNQEPQEIDAMLQEKAMRFERPIPGQSLTNDPDTPLPYEQPPTYTNRDEALEYFFALFVDEENYSNIMELIAIPFPIMDIVKIYLIEAFEEGLINPDMLMILAEPLAYMLMALAERADIDFIIEREEEGDVEDDDDMDVDTEQRSLGVLDNALGRMDNVQKAEDFPEELDQQIQQQEMPQSLLGAR